MENRHPDHNIPLAQRVFSRLAPPKGSLVIQYVSEIGTNKRYFRFMSMPNQIQGHASTPEEAEAKALEIAKRLDLEIHDQIVHVEV